jgi:hypothetical protein
VVLAGNPGTKGPRSRGPGRTGPRDLEGPVVLAGQDLETLKVLGLENWKSPGTMESLVLALYETAVCPLCKQVPPLSRENFCKPHLSLLFGVLGIYNFGTLFLSFMWSSATLHPLRCDFSKKNDSLT